jgi:hypothetical protein
LLFLHPTLSYFQSPESNQDDTSNDDDDDENSTTTTTSINSEDSNDTINDTMAKSSKSTASAATKKSTKKPNNKKTSTEMEAINLDTPPRKKSRATATALHYSVDMTRGFAVNPYAKGLKNKINIVLHKGGVSPNDAQPHVTLLPGGMMLSIQWKAPKKLYTELQATAQKIRRDAPHFMGYSDTMQLMRNNGVTAMEGYHRGAPQIIHLDIECTGDLKVMCWKVPTKVRMYYKKKSTYNSIQCISAR